MIPIAGPTISEAAKCRVEEVLNSGMLAAGEEVEEFEAVFADYIGTDHAVATSSGTTALSVMLEAAGIGEDDVVLTSPFSFVASANAIQHVGATPIFADVRPETGNLDPESVREVLATREDVTALLPVHLYGLPADMDAFQDIADEFDVRLFEDSAQAHGATVGGRSVGSLGEVSAFSFYPTKNMTTGEGGMITTDDNEIASRAQKLINHGRTGEYEHGIVGYNYRMTNIAAAIGIEQLRKLPDWVTTRQENANRLTDVLGETPVQTPIVPPGRTHAFHQYTIRVDDRYCLIDALEDADVGYGIYYPKPIPDQPAYDDAPESPPNARHLSNTVVSLPVHQGVSASDIDRIAETVSASVEAQR